MRKGFTLVELSIVLVIIGLLIGGILVAQSMIETNRVLAFVRQVQQYDIGVSNFRQKYNSLPGDNQIFLPIGDSNGLIQDSKNPRNDDKFDFEIANFWPHLYLAGQIKESYANLPINFPSVGVNCPITAIGNKACLLVGVSSANATDSILFNGESRNQYAVVGLNQAGSNMGAINALMPKEASAYDTKADDGLPMTGNVKASTVGGSGDLNEPRTNPCATTLRYSLATGSQYVCSLAILLLSQNSEDQ